MFNWKKYIIKIIHPVQFALIICEPQPHSCHFNVGTNIYTPREQVWLRFNLRGGRGGGAEGGEIYCIRI